MGGGEHPVKIKPTHLRKAAEVLEEGDFADSTEAARAVIKAVDALRADDITYMVVRQYVSKVDRSPTYMAYGPYSTFNEGTRAIEAGRVGLVGFGVVAVVPVKSPQAVDAKFKEIDQLPDHVKGSHWAILREKVGLS